MERVLQHDARLNTGAVPYEKAVAEFEQEMKKAEEVTCNQLLTNLLKTNLKLLKLNELSLILF